LINLKKLDLSNNKIIVIEKINNLINLQDLKLSLNPIVTINMDILNCRSLKFLDVDQNVAIPPIIQRFLNIHKLNSKKINLYYDQQNIHDSTINQSVKKSIINLLNDYANQLNETMIESTINEILNDDIINQETKQTIIEYCKNKDTHTNYDLNFSELLTIIWIVNKEKSLDTQCQIKKILCREINDSICKCFTGRMTRLLNTLNGFDDRVNIHISDSIQIANVIILIKNKTEYINYEHDHNTKELLKKEVSKELTERGYSIDDIQLWLRYLDEE
jgi:hypothetical protein